MASYQVSFPGGKRVDCSFKNHTVCTDQPEKAGGTDTAPAPFDVFIASIGTCAGIYAVGFCEQRGLSTEGMALVVETEKNAETGLIGEVKLLFTPPIDFPEKYLKAIVNAMDLCAVKKHIMHPPTFTTTIVNE